jgi:FkbM family methyltransferase
LAKRAAAQVAAQSDTRRLTKQRNGSNNKNNFALKADSRGRIVMGIKAILSREPIASLAHRLFLFSKYLQRRLIRSILVRMGFQRAITEKLIGGPAYRPARFAYQTLFNREAIRSRRNRKDLYRSIIRPGDLVFDVGANVGDYAETFANDLGATVVAVEPDPRNMAVLKKRFRNKRVYLEECALGRLEGTADLLLSNRRDVSVGDGSTVSTLSQKFAISTGQIIGDRIPVQVRTLDALAAQYGVPRFVKVDAEGFDAEILRGMSFHPEVVSFEFLPADLSIARDCISLFPNRYFNLTLEEQSRFAFDEWLPGASILDAIVKIPDSVFYGDVFARLGK